MQAEFVQLTLFLLLGTVWFSLLCGIAAFLSILRQVRLTHRDDLQLAPLPASKSAALHPALQFRAEQLPLRIQPQDSALVEQKVS